MEETAPNTDINVYIRTTQSGNNTEVSEAVRSTVSPENRNFWQQLLRIAKHFLTVAQIPD